MPTTALKPCMQSGCRALVSGGYCVAHTRVIRAQADQHRGSSTERGYGYKWQQASKGYLRRHPLCECPDCLEGKLQLLQSEVVDHIIPHRLKEAKDSGNQEQIARAVALMWDRNNWMAMNKRCHDRKTARKDGGFTGSKQHG